uniref:Cytochrome c oxidase subunit 3 n=1 Tax=Tsukubamonas globosa TaxID=875863 RepID=W8VJV7_9EUKA|nr:cytochrome c oxidase subunit 3 [Tsukubamonas globosa]BAO51970.1 cytochrome c oxidase subunit 3 [Tsukubamonas globosa]
MVTNVQQHPYHLVDASPWPMFMGLSSLFLTTGFVLYMHGYNIGGTFALVGLLAVLLTLFLWWRDVVREATFEGKHTSAVQQGLKYGMILFISSEVMFFVAFFWAFFSVSLSPTVEIGCTWPPYNMPVINTWTVPFLNTLILVTSGATLTWSHHAMREGNRKDSILGLVLTIVLAAVFTGFQAMEYIHAPFTMSDGIYGSVFYMATGFHGFHVIIGTLFLTVCLYRHIKYHFTREHHLGFEFAAWYWHFVDVVWLFLFVSIYWWGNS